MAEAFRPDGKLNIPTQAAADYIAEQGQIMPRELSLQDRARGALAKLIGGENYTRSDYVTAGNIIGNPDEGIAEGLGVADITPLGLVFGADDAIRGFRKAEGATDYVAPAVGLGLSALEALPATKILTKPLRSFLGNLSRKTSDITDPSRRDFVAGAVAFPGVAAGVFPFIEAASTAAKAAPSIQPPDIKMLDSIVDTPSYKEFVDFFNLESMSPGFKQRATEGVPDSVYESVAEEAGSINKFLKSDIDSPYEFEGLKDSAVIIDELMDVYGMSKSEVKAYLKKEGILE